MTTSSSKWFIRPEPTATAHCRLYTLPYAGAGASLYYKWAQPLAQQGIELVAVQLPGRENRLAEPLINDSQQLVAELANALAENEPKPYALFGHSMGAVLAYELAQAMSVRKLPSPTHLFVSGRNAPHRPSAIPALQHLDDITLLNTLAKLFGNLSEAVIKEPELRDIITPILRADFTLLEKYQARPQAPLTCSITVLSGEQDPWTDHEGLREWERYTDKATYRHNWPAGHFFINEQASEVMAHISKILATNTTAKSNAF